MGIYIDDMDEAFLSKAVGLFNVNGSYPKIKLDLGALGLKGSYMVRDLWRQKDLGRVSNTYAENIRAHRVLLLKITK